MREMQSIRSKPENTPGQLRLAFNENTNAHGTCFLEKQTKLHAVAYKNGKSPKQVITWAGIKDESCLIIFIDDIEMTH